MATGEHERHDVEQIGNRFAGRLARLAAGTCRDGTGIARTVHQLAHKETPVLRAGALTTDPIRGPDIRGEVKQVPGRLENTSCIVTGAGRGVGRGIALRLAQEGASVCVADINVEATQRVSSEIEAEGGKARACLCDVADRESVRSMVDETVSAFGRLDVIFNNAGISEVKLFLDIKEDDWHKIMNVNGLGVLLCMQEAARVMIAQGDGGKIINTASIAGKQGYPGNPHYCASKFAVVALTQAGARTFGKYGITVNSFCPGVVNTELWEQLDAEFLALGETERPGQAMEEFAAGILLGRVSTPDDIVGLAAFLASHDSDYITGQSIHVDGGMVLV